MVEPGKKPSLGRLLDPAGKRERPREVGDDRDDFERRELLLQIGRALLEIFAGDVDRHISRGRDRFEQDRRLGRRAGAEFDDRGALGMWAAISGMIA